MNCLFALAAAIYLRDVELVRKLLHLGAQNSSSSALNLAVNISDRFGKMAQRNGLSGASDANDMAMSDSSVEENDEAPTFQRSEFDQIVDLLNEHRDSSRATLHGYNEPTNTSGVYTHHCNKALRPVATKTHVHELPDKNSDEAITSVVTGQPHMPSKLREVSKAAPLVQVDSATISSTLSKVDSRTKLPVLIDPDWLPFVRRCRFWSRNMHCHNGMKCRFVHKHGPWGEKLDLIWEDIKEQALAFDMSEFKKFVYYKAVTVNGFVWHTAGFANISSTSKPFPGTVVYSEGGNSKISEQGISWYQVQEVAYNALKKAVLVSMWAANPFDSVSSFGHCDGFSRVFQTEGHATKHDQHSGPNRKFRLQSHENEQTRSIDQKRGCSDGHFQHNRRDASHLTPNLQQSASLKNWHSQGCKK